MLFKDINYDGLIETLSILSVVSLLIMIVIIFVLRKINEKNREWECRFGRSKNTHVFNKNMSQLILNATTPEQALQLSDEIVEMIFVSRNSAEGFNEALRMVKELTGDI